MKVRVYIDGFNLYYRALKRRPQHKWLNLRALAESLLEEGHEIDLIRYFTARVSSRAGDPEAPRRQQLYLNAIAALPQLRIHYGSFLTKPKW